jgi:uncharacterized membrane protein
MSDDLDLKPLDPEPRKETNSAPQTSSSPDSSPIDFAAAASTTPMQSAAPSAPDGPVSTLPPGFVPPAVIIEGPDPEPPDLPEPSKDDVEKHKGISIVGYIPPLFIVPLLVAPSSRFARYHANQGLLLFLVGTAVILAAANLELLNWTLFPLLEAFGMSVFKWMGACVTHVSSVFLIVLLIAMAIFGIVNAVNGESKPLPLIGRFQLLKP